MSGAVPLREFAREAVDRAIGSEAGKWGAVRLKAAFAFSLGLDLQWATYVWFGSLTTLLIPLNKRPRSS